MKDKNVTTRWLLPKPEKKEGKFIWKPVVRSGRIQPFGYEPDPDDPDILLPIEEQLELLEEAKEHLKKFSYREVAAWLSANSGRSISGSGLYNRLKNERKHKKEAAILRHLVQKYESLIEKAQKAEGQLGGAGVRIPKDNSEGSSDTETRTD